MKKIRSLSILPALCLAAAVFAGCDNADKTAQGGEITTSVIEETEATVEESAEVTTETETETEAVVTEAANTMIDREGNTITVPSEINTVVSAAPSITEILTGLGLGGRIIAADIYSADVVGMAPEKCTLDFYNLNIEQLIAMAPDVIIINGISDTGTSDPYAELKAAGVNVIYIPSAASIADIKADIQFLADYMGVSENGRVLTDSIDAAVSDVSARVSGAAGKKKVYMEIGAAPYLYTCGSGTYLNEIISLCGGENIYAGESGWISNSEETVIAGNPDVIITNVNYDGYDFNEIRSRAGWNTIKAVADGAVYQVGANETSRASQNVVYGIYQIARAIYPELFTAE